MFRTPDEDPAEDSIAAATFPDNNMRVSLAESASGATLPTRSLQRVSSPGNTVGSPRKTMEK